MKTTLGVLAVAVALMLFASSAEAFTITNVTTGDLLGYDNFEGVAADPADYQHTPANADPDNGDNPGQWIVSEERIGNVQVTSYGNPGAFDGDNYLRLRSTSAMSKTTMAVAEQTTVGDSIHIEMMIWLPETYAIGTINIMGKDANGEELRYIRISPRSDGHIQVRRIHSSYGDAWYKTGLKWTPNEWVKFEIDFEIGSSTCVLTYDGQSSVPVGVYAPEVITLTGVEFGASNYNMMYIDAVPEPGTLSLLGIGGALLAYRRNRK